MLKDITLGQFFPADTPVHRLDPRTKLLCVILYIVALFSAKSVLTYGIMITVLAVSVLVSRVPFKSLTKGLKPVYFVVAFTAVMNMFFTAGTPVADVWLLRSITWEGVVAAVQMVLRIVMLIMGTFLMTYTTSPIALTDGMESLLGPLKKLRLPIHELAMMMSIALRFIPTLIEETDKIMSAQKAAARTLRQAISSGVPKHWFPFWCRCSSVRSAVPMNWLRLWSAAVTTVVRGVQPCGCCGIRRRTGLCWRRSWR